MSSMHAQAMHISAFINQIVSQGINLNQIDLNSIKNNGSKKKPQKRLARNSSNPRQYV